MTQKHKVVVFDLDDTLYKEVDFLKSAYREIADLAEKEFGCLGVYEKMIGWWEIGDNVFEHLISAYRLDLSTNELLEIYRKHFPQLCLDEETRNVMIQLRKTCKMGIVSDGRSLTQRNKINALGLSEFLDWSDIYISDEVGHLKTTPYSFEKIMATYPDCQYLYVGDNPAKDFLVPNRLGWMTVCVLDNGQNIHPQDFTLPVEYLPQRKIKDITELLEIID
jgi:putative hydrolase of the HAD superfamily